MNWLVGANLISAIMNLVAFMSTGNWLSFAASALSWGVAIWIWGKDV